MIWDLIKKGVKAVGRWIGGNSGNLVSAGAALYGGKRANDYNEQMSREQLAMQKEFATHGIRWKVEDAKAAGLHPLFALGAQPA